MGNTTLLDIIGSITTFGFLLLTVLRLNASASESAFGLNSNYLLQRNMVALTVMLEDDLKHVGAGVYDQYGGISLADTSHLTFREVFPGNTVPTTVEWNLEPTAPPGLQNTRIRYISRTVGGVTTMMNFGVTQFLLRYYRVDAANTEIVPPVGGIVPNNTGNIGPISVTIRLESPYRPKAEYLASTDTSSYLMVWRQIRSVSRNNQIQFPQ
jgi:hypothetical protein